MNPTHGSAVQTRANLLRPTQAQIKKRCVHSAPLQPRLSQLQSYSAPAQPPIPTLTRPAMPVHTRPWRSAPHPLAPASHATHPPTIPLTQPAMPPTLPQPHFPGQPCHPPADPASRRAPYLCTPVSRALRAVAAARRASSRDAATLAALSQAGSACTEWCGVCEGHYR